MVCKLCRQGPGLNAVCTAGTTGSSPLPATAHGATISAATSLPAAALGATAPEPTALAANILFITTSTVAAFKQPSRLTIAARSGC